MRSIFYAAAILGLGLALPAPAAAAAIDAKALFQQKCAGCHTIGGGRMVGPDLAGVGAKRDPAWLVRFIHEPDKLIAEGDETAKALVAEYGMPMPVTGVTKEEATALAALFGASAATAGAPSTAASAPVKLAATSAGAATAPPAAAGPIGESARGAQLFTGEVAFGKSGPACISCHHVGTGEFGGGTLSRDLSGVHGRLGAAGLKGALEAMPFPLMKDIYADKPLSPQEIADLTAYFAYAAEQPPVPASKGGNLFGMVGALGTIGLFAGMGLFWPRRRGKGVRKSLVERK